ncbi:hypothetical protein HK097_008994 [Rhizophlyctis rosea]|uniref:Uncharacterized protein n=1 Tax=Rhizophlyctis rosea TaxID=64517 RepID=A0AAD5SBV3_9FUNG|nr:hypothetical protein HK097_008994 [Rhizophlyctis rosea]
MNRGHFGFFVNPALAAALQNAYAQPVVFLPPAQGPLIDLRVGGHSYALGRNVWDEDDTQDKLMKSLANMQGLGFEGEAASFQLPVECPMVPGDVRPDSVNVFMALDPQIVENTLREWTYNEDGDGRITDPKTDAIFLDLEQSGRAASNYNGDPALLQVGIPRPGGRKLDVVFVHLMHLETIPQRSLESLPIRE